MPALKYWDGSAWQYVTPPSLFPTGMMMPFAGSASPDPAQWLICDGSEQPVATYPALDALLGTTYGPRTNGAGAAGSTHFRLPDADGRTLIGAGTATLSPLAGSTPPTGATAHGLGQSSGEELHTLVTGEAAQKAVTTTGRSASHTHGVGSSGRFVHDTGGGSPGNVAVGSGFNLSGQTNAESADHTHNIAGSSAVSGHQTMQPYLAVNYLIKT